MKIFGIVRRIMLMSAVIVFFAGCSGREQEKSGEDKSAEAIDSLEMLSQQIAADTNNASLYYKRAKYYRNENRANDALRDVSRAMQLDPDKEAYFVLLSDIYQDMNKYEDALDLLRRMSEREQPSSPALVKLAKLEMAFDNHRKATRQINRAIEAEPDNPEAWFIKGYIYEEQNNTEEAIKHYLRAIDKDADFVDPFINLGILYSDRGNDRAIDYFNGALNISPENVNALYLLAMYYQQQEMFEKAESTYQNIISFNPDYPHSYFNIGYIALVHQEDYEKAIAYMDKAIEVQPAFYQAYYNRGYAHELSGKYQQARDDYRKALQIMPNYEKAVEGMNRLDNKIY